MSAPRDVPALRRQLQALGPPDPATVEHPERTFLPTEAHRAVLEPGGLVVVGERGEGKSALFRMLTWLSEHELDETSLWPPRFAHDPGPRRRWVQAYGEVAGDRNHPMPDILEGFAKAAAPEHVRLFWWAGALRQLMGATPEAGGSAAATLLHNGYRYDPAQWVAALTPSQGALAADFDALEERLAADGRQLVLTYDGLDRIHDLGARQKLVAALFAVWLSLQNRYRHLSARIFVRPDVFAAARDTFPDASKLRARVRTLSWDREDLFALLARHMAVAGDGLRSLLERPGEPGHLSDAARDRLRVSFEDHPLLGPVPVHASAPARGVPPLSLERRVTQALAGPVVGEGVEKQAPEVWIGTQLADAHRRILPRALLELVAAAAAHASSRASTATALLTLEDLRAGLRAASAQQLQELREEHPVVRRLDRLGPITLPADPTEVRERLAQAAPTSAGDGFGADGAAVVEELRRIGVLTLRTDGRVDLPELYRVGLGFRRRGVDR